MTMVVSLHFGETVVLAADTRVQNILGSQLSFAHDRDTKIVSTGIGFVAGMGLVELLNDVKRQLSLIDVSHTDQISGVIRDARARYRARTTMSDPENWVRQTGWFVTYRTLVDGELRLRVAIYHGSKEQAERSGIRLLEEHSAYLAVRDDRIEEPVEAIRVSLNTAVRGLDNSREPLALASRCLPHLQQAFARVAALQPSVAPTFHLAFQTTKDARGFSEMLSPEDQEVRWRAMM